MQATLADAGMFVYQDPIGLLGDFVIPGI
jgi:hypothetical protein